MFSVGSRATYKSRSWRLHLSLWAKARRHFLFLLVGVAFVLSSSTISTFQRSTRSTSIFSSPFIIPKPYFRVLRSWFSRWTSSRFFTPNSEVTEQWPYQKHLFLHSLWLSLPRMSKGKKTPTRHRQRGIPKWLIWWYEAFISPTVPTDS